MKSDARRRRRGLRTPAGKANEIGFRTQTPVLKFGKRRPGRRRGLRTPAGKTNELGFRTQTPGLKFRKYGPAADLIHGISALHL